MIEADSGSFRDPASRIVYRDERVIRLLSPRGLEAWRALEKSSFHRAAVADGRLIEATELEQAPEGAAGALQHPRLAMITYPYEWTFSMLKDAALLQLDLLGEALSDGLTIKDATPFNIQFVRGRPQFIDVGSFEPYQPGEAWIGYRQFTRQFLFPLMLRAWVGVPFQPWLRGDPEGPTPAQMRALLPVRRKMRPSALLNVVLQARMEERMSGRAVREDLRSAGFGVDMILANVTKLKALVESLEWDHPEEGWSEYHSRDHVARDRDAKAGFLGAALEQAHPGRVLDLGANDGHFTKLAAEAGAHVVAVDSDEAVFDRLYRESLGIDVSLVVTDLANPSPSQGWAGRERPGLTKRARPDLVIAYGLIHHLIYTASIPASGVISWLRRFSCPVVLEFVSPDDVMVGQLTANKLDHEIHPGGEEAHFRSLLEGHFEVVSERDLPGGTRVLFQLRPR